MLPKIALVYCTKCKHQQQAFINEGKKVRSSQLCYRCNRLFNITNKNMIKEVPITK